MEEDILGYFENDLHCSTAQAERMLNELKKHEDIWREFCHWFSTKKFTDNKTCIREKGYSAEELFEKFDIYEVGAFNLLVSLRDNSQETEEYIKKGLPKD